MRVLLASTIFLGMVLAGTPCGVEAAQPGTGFAVENGDINGDFSRDLSDAVCLIGYVLCGHPEPAPLALCYGDPTSVKNGDTNGDGRRNIADAIDLLRWIICGGPPPAAACPQNVAARVVPLDAKPYGRTYGEWSEAWWQWALSIPAATNPILGGACDVNQSGKVWFLAGSAGGGQTERLCTVPSGKSILFSMVNVEADYPCPPDFGFEPPPGQSLEEFLTETARFYIDHVTELEVELDGVPMQELFSYRVTSGLYTFTGDPSLAAVFDPCITGEPQPAVSDGYWIMLAPLSVGSHIIHARGKEVFPEWNWTFESDVTFILDVVPRGRP